MRCRMGSFADGDVEGFSMTVPNCAKAVGVSSSIGIRIEGAGIDVGMFATRLAWRAVDTSYDGSVESQWRSRAGACEGATDAITIRSGTSDPHVKFDRTSATLKHCFLLSKDLGRRWLLFNW